MIKTNPNYWDCECGYNYIHPKSTDQCFICGTNKDEQPDSHQEEIDKQGIK